MENNNLAPLFSKVARFVWYLYIGSIGFCAFYATGIVAFAIA